MYQINSQNNRITPLKIKRFNELGFTERQHLQEWLAHQPDALGEELLIIQKEFDGFDETRERLDLLAVDKEGNLVVIENKLDDSGRDVVWQALKYASYFATSSKLEIISIYQRYLERQGLEGDAQSLLCDFLEVDDIEELKINVGSQQRIILVAANFRKEVTSTVLWLLKKGVDIACFKVTPYALDAQLLLDIEQIIPTPETKELMIGLSAKEAEEKSTEKVLKKRHSTRHDFWTQTLEFFKSNHCQLYSNKSPSNDHWMTTGSGFSGCGYTLIFSQQEIRVELNVTRSDKAENKRIFDALLSHQARIEKVFGQSIIWLRLDDKIASRLQYALEIDGYNRDNWLLMQQWLLEYIQRLELAIKPHIAEMRRAVKEENA